MSLRVRRLSIVGPNTARHVWFCACCGRSGPASAETHPFERVCSKCGVGLLLETAAEIAPEPADAFLVVDNDFDIAAISHRAEELLGVSERSVVRRRVAELLVPAEHEPRGACGLMAAVAETTSGLAGVRPLHLRLRTTHAASVEMQARLGRCGPPVGALIVLEPTEAQRAILLDRP